MICLIEALNKYEGSYILVSHDRYFVNKTANKIWEIEDYKIKEFVGTYDEWERWKQERKALKIIFKKERNCRMKKKQLIVEKKSNNNFQNQRTSKRTAKSQRNFQQLEEKIANSIKKKQLLKQILLCRKFILINKNLLKPKKIYLNKSDQLQKANEEYEKLFEKIMELEEKTV